MGWKEDLQDGMCFFIEVTVGETIDVHPEIQGLLTYPICHLLNRLVTPGHRALKGRYMGRGLAQGWSPK